MNILFHLLLITWHAYFITEQIDDLMKGVLVGKALFFFLFRIAIVIIFSASLWKMTSRKKASELEISK